jgi:hypothetical protein
MHISLYYALYIRKIRAQEKELALLRRLPTEDFLSIDRIRQTSSAK